MNKAQLIEELAKRFDGSKRDAQHALQSVTDTITRAVVSGDKVRITGFGAFEKVTRAARTARNPATGAKVRVKKTAVPRFKAGSELKAVVSGEKKLPKVTAATGTAKSSTPGRKTNAGTTRSASADGTRKSAAKSSAGKASGTKASASKASAGKTSASKASASRSSASKASATKIAKSSTPAAARKTSTSTAKKTPTKRTAKKS